MGDGYVGTAQDAVRIRRLEKQREAERRKIQELKSKSATSNGQPGLLQFGSSTSEILETAFKKETVGLVTREEYVEKRVNIQSKIEEEEKEKLQKQLQEEEELQLQKRKKRKIKGNSRLSFSEDIDNDAQEEEEPHQSNNNIETNGGVRCGKLGKDPTVETSFLPDRSAEDFCSVSERLRSKLNVKGCAISGSVSRTKFEMSLFKSHTAIGMEPAIGVSSRYARVTPSESFFEQSNSNLLLSSERFEQPRSKICFM